jgi:hypothetical protein
MRAQIGAPGRSLDERQLAQLESVKKSGVEPPKPRL